MTKRNDIFTPDGYFPGLREKLNAIPGQSPRTGLVQRVAPWMAYAASLAVLAAAGNFIFSKAPQKPEAAEDWAYLSYLSQSLDPDGLVELKEDSELSEDDIVRFLLAENISVEQLEVWNHEESY